MRITKGKSHENGIDLCFAYGEKKYIVSARRDKNGEIYFDDSKVKVSKQKNKDLKRVIVLMLISIPAGLLYTVANNSFGSSIAGILAFALLLVAMYFWMYWQSKKEEKQIVWRYHAAEHMAMNYVQKFKKAPKNIEELSKMNKIYISCGSMVITFIMLSVFAQFVNFILIKHIEINILLMFLSVGILFVMWGKGYFDFIQELVVREPSEKELEVAMAAFIRMEQMLEKGSE